MMVCYEKQGQQGPAFLCGRIWGGSGAGSVVDVGWEGGLRGFGPFFASHVHKTLKTSISKSGGAWKGSPCASCLLLPLRSKWEWRVWREGGCGREGPD